LIIGGGLSGLEAARLLRENGIKTLILEGRNRTGGRIWSIESPNGYMMDMGAGWIHGINGGIPNGLLSNPLWDLTKKANIPTRGTEHNDFEIFYPQSDSILDIENWYNQYLNFVRENTRTSLSNLSFKYYANLFVKQKNFTSKEENAFYSYLHYTIECNDGAQLNQINAKLSLDLTSVFYGEEHVFHQTGFQELTNYLTSHAGEILFNKIVTQIDTNNDIIQVTTEDGQIYRSEFVLLTVPLGVLKAKQIQFKPSLPQWKLNVIDRIGFGIFEKVILIWNQPWWNSSHFYFLKVSKEPNQFGYWVNANKWNDKPAIISFITDKTILTLEPDQTIEHTLSTLDEMFPLIVIPEPDHTYITNWNEDPFSLGSYSYISIHQNYEDPSYLAEPIEDRLLFAGEATSTDSYGYAHGALITARREVNRLLYVYELLQQNQTTTNSRTINIYPVRILIIISFIFIQFSSK
jgi:monoamine oxidase